MNTFQDIESKKHPVKKTVSFPFFTSYHKWLRFSYIVLCCGENQGIQTFPFCTHLLQITRKLTNGNHLWCDLIHELTLIPCFTSCFAQSEVQGIRLNSWIKSYILISIQKKLSMQPVPQQTAHKQHTSTLLQLWKNFYMFVIFWCIWFFFQCTLKMCFDVQSVLLLWNLLTVITS